MGDDEYARMDEAEIRRLCDAIDGEILKDPELTDRTAAHAGGRTGRPEALEAQEQGRRRITVALPRR